MDINNIVVEIEGVDRTGKDTLIEYISRLSNYKYTLSNRGILSQLVYNDKFDRGYNYTLSYKPFIVYLEGKPEDLSIRGKLTREPEIDYAKDMKAFDAYYRDLRQKGFIKGIRINTSKRTPYDTAIEVIRLLDKVKIEDFRLLVPVKLKNLGVYKKLG